MGRMVAATEFKAKCLALIDEMQRSGEPLTVTRRGKPSITINAERPKPARIEDVLGCMRGTITIKPGVDLDEPLDPNWEEEWLANWDEQLRDNKT